MANKTTTLRLFQDSILCVLFQRNEDTYHNTCPGFNVEEKIADPDPTNAALSTFSVEAKQCFDETNNMVNMVNTECVDAQRNSKAVNISKFPCYSFSFWL